MNIWNLVSKENLGVQFKDGICVEFCLKAWFESDWYFCNITESEWVWKRLPRNKISNNHFLKSIWKSSCPEYPLRNSGYLFPIKWCSISFPIRSPIELQIIAWHILVWKAILYAVSASSWKIYQLHVYENWTMGCFFLKYDFKNDSPEKSWTKTSVGILSNQ